MDKHTAAETRPCLLRLAVAVASLLLVAQAEASEPAEATVRDTVFHFELTPSQVVDRRPARAGMTATATLNIVPRQRTLGRVSIDGPDPSRVTLNAGHAGESGPVIAEFVQNADGTWLLQRHFVFQHLPYEDAAGYGYYVQVESESGALRGQIAGPDWHITVTRLSPSGLIPQLPIAGEAIAGFTVRPDDGSFHVRLTTKDVPRAMRARLRTSVTGGDPRTVVELEPATYLPGVWGSGDINDDCHHARLPAGALRAYREGRLLIDLDVFEGMQQSMQARLLPPVAHEAPIRNKHQRGIDR